jgi:hypothetical protein
MLLYPFSQLSNHLIFVIIYNERIGFLGEESHGRFGLPNILEV